MEFNKEEISLCKQVAEKYRKRIDDGDWYLRHDYDEPDVYLEGMDDDKAVAKSLPLWTISDCLEFLRERDYRINLHENVLTDGIEVTLNHPKRIEDITNFIYKGKVPLEACLKAVLAVLEGKK